MRAFLFFINIPMSKLIFMNTFDCFTIPADVEKYWWTANRSRSYGTEGDLVLCLTKPTSRRQGHHQRIQQEWLPTYIPIPAQSTYPKNQHLIKQLQTLLSTHPVDDMMWSFIVSEQVSELATMLWLQVESDRKGVHQGNDKRHILQTLWTSNLAPHIMEWTVFQVGEWYDAFVRLCSQYCNEEGIVRCKYPTSISGNGVRRIHTKDSRELIRIWEQVLNNWHPWPWCMDGEVIIQRNIPDIIWFYNVMTYTTRLGDIKELWAWVTKQLIQGNSHTWNGTDLSRSHKDIPMELPIAIEQEIIKIAKQVSELYFQKFWSTGHSWIDFAVSYTKWDFHVRIMEVNDRINGCFPLHYFVDKKIISPKQHIITLRSQPYDPSLWSGEQLIFQDKTIYNPDKTQTGKTYIPLSDSWTSYQFLQLSPRK